MTPDEVLAWEAQNRPRAAFAALAAAFLTITGVLLTTVGQPSAGEFDDKIVTVVDAMGRTAAGEPVPPGRIAAYTLDVGNAPIVPIIGAVLYALGSLAIFWAMGFLFRAIRGRRPEFQQFALILAAVGAVGYGLGRGVAEISRYIGAHDFVSAADQSNSAASDALSPPAALIGQIIWQAAALSLGFAFVLISLNAMRVGLLTRFMGVLGIIVGVTFVLPLDQQGIIRVFWLAALGALFAGRWPSGMPKAWTTGEAEPWPSQQQLREQREAMRAERAAASGKGDAGRGERESRPSGRSGPPAAPPPKAPSPRRPDPAAAGTEHSASKKKKRKRRH
jgi:MFS family permease